MMLALEFKKLKRTGLCPAFFLGGLLAAAIPAANMAFRGDVFTTLQKPPMEILLGANWQMMTMLNMFLIVVGACIMYHTEFADNAAAKLEALPTKSQSIYWGKFLVLAILDGLVVLLETAALGLCAMIWFQTRIDGAFLRDILLTAVYALAFMLPVTALMLAIASACKNMWISLGIGVIGICAVSVIPTASVLYTIFPFTVPFETPAALTGGGIDGAAGIISGLRMHCGPVLFTVAAIQTLLYVLAECVYLNVRRSFQ